MVQVPQRICSKHRLTIKQICKYSGCNALMAVCQKCIPEHQGHEHQLESYDDFVDALTQDIVKFELDRPWIKESAKVVYQHVEKCLGQYHDRAQTVNKTSKKYFNHQEVRIAEQIIKEEADERIKNENRIISYFQTLQAKELFKDRLLLSSPEGRLNFSKNYEQYRSICAAKSKFKQLKVDDINQMNLQDKIRQKIIVEEPQTVSQNVYHILSKIKKKYQSYKNSRVGSLVRSDQTNNRMDNYC